LRLPQRLLAASKAFGWLFGFACLGVLPSGFFLLSGELLFYLCPISLLADLVTVLVMSFALLMLCEGDWQR